MNKSTAIQLTNISKRYFFKNDDDQQKEFWALKNINLTIKKGEHVGLVGPNGAGKTTLLKTIAGITKPTSGIVTVQGKIASLIELLAGFEPDLNGIENTYLNGLLIGMDRDQIRQNLSDIIAYAGLKNFINHPLYSYSSGMKFRLAFSIAKHSSCDIMLIDELFGYGDAEFQTQVLHTLDEFRHRKITIVICTHLPIYIWKIPTSCYFFENGQLQKKNRAELYKSIRIDEEKWRDSIKFPFKP